MVAAAQEALSASTEMASPAASAGSATLAGAEVTVRASPLASE
jgi:hypothetical protein